MKIGSLLAIAALGMASMFQQRSRRSEIKPRKSRGYYLRKGSASLRGHQRKGIKGQMRPMSVCSYRV